MICVGWPLNHNGAPAASSFPLRVIALDVMISGGAAWPCARKVTVWNPLIAQLTESPTWISVADGKKPLKSRCLRPGGFGGPAETGALSATAMPADAQLTASAVVSSPAAPRILRVPPILPLLEFGQ